ncbi:MAG: NAD-dependent epimerase/dehydratase family protein, partial [Acidimicrobiales bacterium]|nr:NAD-dependent epimerase/dehydratase family protein [Acidimicrobiales bacterium]
MIRDSLENKRILVTGATGFLGTALVERLLRSVPNCHIVVLIRPGQRQSAQDRCKREIIRHDCFDTLRAKLGDRFDQEIESRLTTISGDVGTELLGLDEAGLLELAKCDIAIHSAATVSFDAALDQAVEVNLLGPSRVAKALAHVASSRPNGPAHMIAVSTAYVSGGHRGDAPEVIPTKAPFALDLNWEAEVTSARRIRSDAEAQSRSISKMA